MSSRPPEPPWSPPPPLAFRLPTTEEQRRSPRVPCVVALVLECRFTSYVAESIVVSSHGALIQTSESFSPGISILVSNPDLGLTIPARVISSRPGGVEGIFAVAVEFGRPASGLWGTAYKT